MPIIPVGFAQINWRFVGSSMPNGAEVTLGCNPDPSLSPAETAEAAHGAVAVEVMPIVSSEVVLLDTLVKFGPNATGPSAVAGEAVAGSAAATTVAPQVAVLVRKVTLAGGRESRGRMYWPGAIDSQIGGDGALDSTAVTNWAGAMDALLTALETALIFPVILHNSVNAPTTIVDFNLDARVATQRRRNRR